MKAINKYLRQFREAFKTDSDPILTLKYVIFFSAIIGLISQIISYSSGLIFAYNDAGLHLDVARRFYDSRDPGFINQIGVVWLPLPHLILAPFVYFDVLWITGLAGSIVGFFYYIATCGFLYRILRNVTGENHSSLFGLAFFALNPNILYLYSVAMTEPLFILLICISIYHIINWYNTEFSGEIVRAGIAAGLACMTRYEGWWFTVLTGVLMFMIAVFYRKKHPLRNLFYFFLVPALAVLWYLYHNWSIAGDYLAFQRGQYSSAAQVDLRYASIGGAPYKHNFLLSTDIINNAILYNSGYVLLAAGIVGFVIYLFNKKLKLDSLIPVLLLLFYPFNILSMYLGQVSIELPTTFPKGYFQSRYVITILPGLAIFLGYSLMKIKNINFRLVTFILLFLINNLWFSIVWPIGVAAIGEAQTTYLLSQPFRRVAYYMKTFYDHKNVLYDDFSIIFFAGTGIPIKERIYDHSWDYGEAAMKSPSQYVGWVIINTLNKNDKIRIAMNDNLDFKERFRLVLNEGGIEVYKRIDK